MEILLDLFELLEGLSSSEDGTYSISFMIKKGFPPSQNMIDKRFHPRYFPSEKIGQIGIRNCL